MAPNSLISPPNNFHNAWWAPRDTIQNFLIRFYNTQITRKMHDFSIRNITNLALARILCNINSLEIFPESSHFITKHRMLIQSSDLPSIIICPQCMPTHPDQEFSSPDNWHQIHGGQHFTLPSSMIVNLLEMSSLWCSICGVKNFEWFENSHCHKCSP